MAYTPPTLADFIEVFPAFSAVTQTQYDFWVAQAVLVTEPIEGCLGPRMDLATMLATAHYLTEQGLGTGAESEMAAQGASGFRRIKSGTLELERAQQAASDPGMGDWGATNYGTRLFPMLRACLAGPRVTSTGTLPCGTGYQSGPFRWQ